MSRPTKFKPKMCRQVIELMEKGASLVEVAAELGICEDTLHDWKKNKKEFSESIKRGVQLSQAWWERQGRENLVNHRFQSALWYMNMKNRFKWADKHEYSGPGGGPIETKDHREKLKNLSNEDLRKLKGMSEKINGDRVVPTG